LWFFLLNIVVLRGVSEEDAVLFYFLVYMVVVILF
jgi:hypothetical protein